MMQAHGLLLHISSGRRVSPSKGLPDKLLLRDRGEKPGQCVQRIPACIFSTPPGGMRTPPVP